jgi:serine/threonine protein kinase/Tol biopolymer transport system component
LQKRKNPRLSSLHRRSELTYKVFTVAELSPGATLAHYRIISHIGAGGMGEVYRAQDTELGRSVALKFLPEEVAVQQSRVRRFIQEAKAASALNHPNILTVYEIGREETTTYIATEFVDGVTLRQHMRLRRLRLPEILDIGIQVASALVAAHAAGIVHRDIKPENIMVRKDGIVKILDFGLAKLTERQDSSTGSEATTIAIVNTEPGTVLGTAAYMSPEQAAGRDVDARSDIWSLGVVLYEMIAARPPFEGASKSHIIVAITDREPPPLTQFAPDAPQPLEWIIAETLTKDRDERCQTAKELVGKLKRLKQRLEAGTLPTSPSDLDHSAPAHPSPALAYPNIHSTPSPQATVDESIRPTALSSGVLTTKPISEVHSVVATRSPRRMRIAAATAGLALLVLGAVAFGLYTKVFRPKELGPARLTALTTGGKINGEDINGQVSISPDGRYVVCAANDNKQQGSLWIRQIATNSLVRLVQPENGGYLGTTFSPDGNFVYYVATLQKNGFTPTLYRVPVLGGPSTRILDRVFSPVGFTNDGQRLAFVRKNQEDTSLVVANTDGSGEQKVIAVAKAPNSFSTFGPSWSDDGTRVAAGMSNGTGYSTLVEVSVDGSGPKPIDATKWASIGRIIWLTDMSGLIVAAQPESSSIGTQIWFVPYHGGPPRRITNDLNGYGEVSLGVTADSGTIATIQQSNVSSIWVANANDDEGHALQILKTNLPETVAWTPDEKIVYAARTGETWDIWIANRDGADSRQLTADAYIDQQPSVSADGRYIVFQSNRAGARNIWRMDLDGSNPKPLTNGGYVDSYPVCSPDGRSVVFMSERSGKSSIWKVGIDGGSPVQVTDRLGQFPTISPDGKLLAYFYADEQANNQPKLSILNFEGGAQVKTIDLPRSVQAIAFAWTPDGKSIAYLDNATGILNVWSQPIDGGAPKQLTNFKSEFLTSFAISRDGKIAAYRWSATRDIVLIKDFR